MTEPWNDPSWVCVRCGAVFASDSPYYPPATFGTDDAPLCFACAALDEDDEFGVTMDWADEDADDTRSEAAA
jgi:hypothetical protein